MLRQLLISIFLVFVSVSAKGQDTISSPAKISLLFIGDIMGHDEQISSAENRETHTYSYNDVFRYIRSVISEADIAIGNFEVTLAGPPYKGYPLFSSPASLATACKDAGIDYLVTANNHSADRGKTGITGTINRLDSIGIPHTGTFPDQAAKDSLHPLMIKQSGFSLALLNYTYGTNGLRIPAPVIVNMLDQSHIINDIEKARKQNPDLIILFLHWGTEYDTIPSKIQTHLAENFFSHGVDLIIGSHPHVLQKMVWNKRDSADKDRIVVYSLGNFITNQRKPKTDGGSIVRIELTRNGDLLNVSDAGYYLTWVYTPIEKYRKKFYILPCSEYENKPEFFTDLSSFSKMKKFITDSRALLYEQNMNFREYIFSGNEWLKY